MTDLVRHLPNPITKSADLIVSAHEKLLGILSPNATPQTFLAAAVMAANDLDKASPMSVVSAVWHCAKMGLIPDTAGSPWGHAYLIPFKGECTAVVGYKGFLELAYRSQWLRSVYTDVILADEECDYFRDETGPRFMHRPGVDRNPTRQNIVGAYCHYQSEAGPEVVRLSKSQIEKVYKSAKTKKVWDPHFPEMAMKTAIRRAAKNWRMTAELSQAVHLDEAAEIHGRQEQSPDVPEQRMTLDDLADDQDGDS